MPQLILLTRTLTALAGLLFSTHFAVAQPGGTIEIVQTGTVYEGAESRRAATAFGWAPSVPSQPPGSR